MPIHVRPEAPADATAIFAVNEQAFQRPEEAQLVEALRGSQTYVPDLSLAAVADDQVVGHIMFTIVDIVQPDGSLVQSLALAPMAVLPAWQQQGVGTQLVESGLAQAKALGYRSVIVLGHENYYPRFGFRSAQEWEIQAPFVVPPAAFMAMELVPNGLAGVHGVVRYSAPFGI